MGLRVQLVGDDLEFRESLRLVLDREPDMVVTGSSPHDGAPSAAPASRADVVILDAERPDDAWLVTRALKDRYRRGRVLVLLGNPRPDTVRAALSAGAAGVVGKIQPVRVLLGAIRVVGEGGSYVCPDLVSLAIFDGEARTRLTSREYEIFERTIRGCAEAQITRELTVSPRMVRQLRNSMLAKLGASSPVDLLRMAVEGRGRRA